MAKVSPGDKLRISANDFNSFVDVADAFKMNSLPFGAAGQSVGSEVVLVRNDSGADVANGSVLGIAAATVSGAGGADAYITRLVLSAVTPTIDHASHYAVTLEPIRNAAIGRACIAGACPARVNITSLTHQFAAITAGQKTLTSGNAGNAIIIHHLLDTTGEQWAWIRIGGTAQPAGNWFWFDGYASTTPGNDYTLPPATAGTVQEWCYGLIPAGQVTKVSAAVYYSYGPIITAGNIKIRTATTDGTVFAAGGTEIYNTTEVATLDNTHCAVIQTLVSPVTITEGGTLGCRYYIHADFAGNVGRLRVGFYVQ